MNQRTPRGVEEGEEWAWDEPERMGTWIIQGASAFVAIGLVWGLLTFFESTAE